MAQPVILYPSQQNIDNAVKKLKKDEIIVFPTETVYGIGASAFSDKAIKKIYKIKNRPNNNPLIVHYSNLTLEGIIDIDTCIEQISENFIVNNTFLKLFKKFAPGPLTFILYKKNDCKISPLCSAYLPKQALRVPNHPVALELIHKFGKPLAAPSANISNSLSPTTAEHVYLSLGGNDLMILDGGRSLYGIESTVIDVSDPENIYILRNGGISIEALLKAGISPKLLKSSAKQLLSPGMMHKHYSPKASLRLNAKEIMANEALLAFGEIDIPIPNNTLVFNLSKTANLTEAAHNLFKMLWDFDKQGIKKVAVMEIPNKDLGLAINERLRKAALSIESNSIMILSLLSILGKTLKTTFVIIPKIPSAPQNK